jgi:glycosyltransferase involved in cell wall biosynthesis
MRVTTAKLLNSREITTGPLYGQAVTENLFTVYIGIYNGQPYLNSLLEQIQSQTIQNFPLIIVDNQSTDESWKRILEWPAEVRNRSKLIRNPLNLGGSGSFALNFSEVQTDWLITLHQDDSYGTNHLSILSEEIGKSSNKEVVVFTDMGTQDMDGQKIFTPIRQSWVANLESDQSAFRANLVQQSVSYPSSAFRTTGISPIQIAWHSSSFPDTEITLLQASKGSFRFVPKQTMLYRMNPKSESHDLNPRERVLGPFASLCRVMASDSFLSLCAAVPEKDRPSFAKSVLEGIDTRLGESSFSEIVKMVASETMGMAWDYSESVSRDQLLKTYRLAEDGRTTKLLRDLGAFYEESDSLAAPSENSALTNSEIHLVQLLDEAAPPSNTSEGGAQKALLTFVGRILPLGIRRKVIAFLVRVYSKFDPKSPWNLSWKPKH